MKKAISAARLNTTSSGILFLRGVPFIILSSYGYLALQTDLRLAVPEMLGVTALVLVMLTGILYAGEKGKVYWSPAVILLIAFTARILFLFRGPELSDDIYRYLWDGLQTVSGQNPYSLAPSDLKTHGETTGYLLRYINHPDLVTIYPPFAQLIFASGAAITHSLTGLKAVLVALDLGTCFMIIKILSSMDLPVWRASLYAWHPLPVLEIAGSGHIDGAGILFIFLTVYIIFLRTETNRTAPDTEMSAGNFAKRLLPQFIAGLLFAAAVLVKFIPLIWLPVFLVAGTGLGGMMFFIGFISGLISLIVPFLPDLKNMTATLGTYLHNWEFSSFTFRTLRDLIMSGRTARMVLLAFFSIAVSILSVHFLLNKRKTNRKNTFSLLMKTIYGITFSFLLFTPTLHPWYALYLAAILPFEAGVGGLVLGWTVFLSYHVQIRYLLLGQWTESGLIAAVIWLAPVCAVIFSRIARRLSKEH